MLVSTDVHAISYIDDAPFLETKNFIENLIECSQQTQRIFPCLSTTNKRSHR